MTEQHDDHPQPDQDEGEQAQTGARKELFPELAELEEKIQRRLRSNQRFLERFMDEDFDDLDDEDIAASDDDDDDAEPLEEL
jgi:hypothetical protein